MQSFVIYMTDRDGNVSYDLVKFPSIDEAQSYTPKDKDCAITKISIYDPDSPGFQLPVFEFEAINPDGHSVKDIIEAPTEIEAKTRIEEMGFTITKFTARNNTPQP